MLNLCAGNQRLSDRLSRLRQAFPGCNGSGFPQSSITAGLVLAGLLFGVVHASETGTCAETLHGRAPAAGELSTLVPVMDGDGLQVQVIDDHRLVVVTRRPDLPELTINGGAAEYSWHEVNGVGAVLLEQCGLARGALSLMAGSEHLEWVGPDFFEARPETASEAASLRTFSRPGQALGRDREVYLVTPEGWDGAAGDPLLISGDALAASTFGAIVETLVANGQIRPVAFASVRFGEGMLDGTRVAVRSAEYHLSGGSTPEAEARRTAYEAHEKFFFDEFLPFVIEELGGEIGPVYTFGISSSASFALDQALMRGDLIAGVIAASPPIHPRTRELANQITTRQTIRLWCGTLEEMFCNPIRNLAQAHGYPLQFRHAAHQTALWEEALAASLIELFPASRSAECQLDGEIESLDVYGTDVLAAADIARDFCDEFISMAEAFEKMDYEKWVAASSLVEEQLKARGEFAFLKVSRISYFGEKTRHHFTIDVVEARDAERRMAFRSSPDSDLPDPGGLIRSWHGYQNEYFRLLSDGTLVETNTCEVFHCLAGFDANPELQPYLDLFNRGVQRHEEALHEILARSRDARHRAAAAFLLAHSNDPERLLAALRPAIYDTDSSVRNNAMRVIWAMIAAHPSLEYPLEDLVRAMDFPTVEDRSKAVSAVARLAEIPEYRRRIEDSGAIPVALRLLRLKQPINHEPAHALLKAVSGKDFGARDYDAWDGWYAEH